MSTAPQSQGRADREAAEWFARLNSASVTTQALTAFRAWRRDPGNDAAYSAVETLWRSTAPLAHDPDVATAVREARSRTGARRRIPLSAWLAPVGALAVAGVVAAVVIQPWRASGRIYQTAVGEQSLVTLDDGSRVRLDTNSRIAVHFTKSARAIQLVHGQAFFDVLHRPDRPLSISAGDTVIQDLGTRFDVRRYAAGVRVTVLEGSVQVTTPSQATPWTLTQNEQLTTGSHKVEPVAVDAAKATSWTGGRLVFDDLPLSSAVAEMNRYSPHKLLLDADGVGDTKVNGAFDSTDTAAFVSAVTRLYDLKAEPQADGAIRLANATLDRPRR